MTAATATTSRCDDARDLSSLLGKILRISPTAGGGYTVPADNPYFGPETVGPQRRDEIWSYGLRNPFRFSFDRQTGDIFMATSGRARWRRSTSRPRGRRGRRPGRDYGWDDCEGSLAGRAQAHRHRRLRPDGDTLPVLEHAQAGGDYCSIIGGYVVRDPGLEALAGRYLYGDLCHPHLRSIAPAGPGRDDRVEAALVVELDRLPR